MRLLLVEDDRNLSDILRKGLKEEKYVVDTAYDGEEGEYLASINNYDVMILDVRLPKLNGYDLCELLRKNKINTPILMLTSNDTVNDKITGLDYGADDYMTKPFDFDELLARLRALLRRKYLKLESKVLKNDDLILNLSNNEAKRNNNFIELTSLEFRLLKYFMLNTDRVLSRTMIREHVWDMNFDKDSNVVDVYINYLRKKIDKNSEIKLIETVRGMGYIMREYEN